MATTNPTEKSLLTAIIDCQCVSPCQFFSVSCQSCDRKSVIINFLICGFNSLYFQLKKRRKKVTVFFIFSHTLGNVTCSFYFKSSNVAALLKHKKNGKKQSKFLHHFWCNHHPK